MKDVEGCSLTRDKVSPLDWCLFSFFILFISRSVSRIHTQALLLRTLLSLTDGSLKLLKLPFLLQESMTQSKRPGNWTSATAVYRARYFLTDSDVVIFKWWIWEDGS